MSQSNDQLPQELKDLQQRIEQWRQNRPCKGPMPEELWIEAARLGSKLSLGKVAGKLNLGYLALKRRMVDKDEPIKEPREKKFVRSNVQFIEYRQEESINQSKAQPGAESKSIEFELHDPTGNRLVMRIPLYQIDSISTCLKQMWELRTCCK